MHFVPSFCPLTALHSHYSGRKSDTEPRPWRPLPLDLIYIETNHGCLHSGSCCPNTCAAVATSPQGVRCGPPAGYQAHTITMHIITRDLGVHMS